MLLLAAPLLMGAGYDARTNYILHCQGCHGADGVGGVPEKVPPLRDAIGHFLHVPGGREFLIQVPGVEQAPIDDGELAALLNYVLHRYSEDELPDAFLPYTAEEVARVRRAPVDVIVLRAELVAALHDRLGIRVWTLKDPIVARDDGGPDGPRN